MQGNGCVDSFPSGEEDVTLPSDCMSVQNRAMVVSTRRIVDALTAFEPTWGDLGFQHQRSGASLGPSESGVTSSLGSLTFESRLAGERLFWEEVRSAAALALWEEEQHRR
jgi:hypothetical protein